MLAAAIVAVLVALALMLVRALRGPTIFDRLVAANSIGNAAIVFLALFGFLTGRPEFLDIGLAYALLNIIGVFAVLKFFRYGPLGATRRGRGGGGMTVADIVAMARRRHRRSPAALFMVDRRARPHPHARRLHPPPCRLRRPTPSAPA